MDTSLIKRRTEINKIHFHPHAHHTTGNYSMVECGVHAFFFFDLGLRGHFSEGTIPPTVYCSFNPDALPCSFQIVGLQNS